MNKYCVSFNTENQFPSKIILIQINFSKTNVFNRIYASLFKITNISYILIQHFFLYDVIEMEKIRSLPLVYWSQQWEQNRSLCSWLIITITLINFILWEKLWRIKRKPFVFQLINYIKTYVVLDRQPECQAFWPGFLYVNICIYFSDRITRNVFEMHISKMCLTLRG